MNTKNSAYKLRINVRPVKFAYFIRENDKQSLEAIMSLVCTQWGGIRNLIIPVGADGSIHPLFEHLLKLHEPDLFVSYLSDSWAADKREATDGLHVYLQNLWPHRLVSVQLGKHFEKHDRTVHALSVIGDDDLEQGLWVHAFLGDAEDHWLLHALFGQIYPGQEKSYREIIELKRDEVALTSDWFWSFQHDASPFSSVLDLTSYGIAPYWVRSGTDSNHFDVVLVSSLASLCLFWNYRATRDATHMDKNLGRRTLMLPALLLTRKDSIQSMLGFIRAKLAYPGTSSTLHVNFCCWERDDHERLLRAIRKVENLEKLPDKKWRVNHTWRQGEPTLEDFSAKPITYAFTYPLMAKAYREGVGRSIPKRTEFDTGPIEALFEPPEEFRNRFGGQLMVDLECDVRRRYPRDRQVADTVKQYSWFSRYGISWLGSMGDRPQYVDFIVPEEAAALKAFFKSRGYETRLSRPATYTNALITLLGGIQNVAQLASNSAYILLDTLALKSSKKLAQRITKQLGGQVAEDDIQRLLEDVEVVPELKRIPKTYRQLVSGALKQHKKDLLGLLNELSLMQIVKRGFHLSCPNCGTSTWHHCRPLKKPHSAQDVPTGSRFPWNSREAQRFNGNIPSTHWSTG